MVKYPVQSLIKVALLRHLAKHGPTKPAEVYEPLANQFGLSRARRTEKRVTVPVKVWDNKVAWARQALKNDGYLAAQRGVWELSEAGKEAAQRPSAY